MRKKLILLSLPAILFCSTINFESAIAKTLLNNKSLKAKKLSIKNAKLDLENAKGYNYGTLTFNENIAKSNNALNAFGMKLTAREAQMKDFGFTVLPPAGTDVGEMAPDALNNPEARTNYETKLTYEVPLFTGFKLSNAKTMAQLQIKANEAKYKHDEKQLGLEVLKAYNGAVASKYFIEATSKAKEATSSFVYFALEMFKEGFVTSIDVKQAQ
ncbi:MAG: TolC family protein, partial [Arcobacteraceae bacterium]|nr:TolC family protein [Arcobacteraceae bacterium]